MLWTRNALDLLSSASCKSFIRCILFKAAIPSLWEALPTQWRSRQRPGVRLGGRAGFVAAHFLAEVLLPVAGRCCLGAGGGEGFCRGGVRLLIKNSSVG